MSEIEQAHGYAYNRVLIESERILDPPFSDAVVFLSGAQIEMLRNVTQYLNRQETYVTEYNPGYYNAPSDDDFDDILEIVADLEETLMGNQNTIWGYAERWAETTTTVDAGENPTEVSPDPVPAGYVYVVEMWSAYHNSASTRLVVMTVGQGAENHLVYTTPALASAEWVIQRERLTLKEGDTLTWSVYGLEIGKLCSIRVWGYMMKVPE